MNTIRNSINRAVGLRLRQLASRPTARKLTPGAARPAERRVSTRPTLYAP
jgi:hypothetical protein